MPETTPPPKSWPVSRLRAESAEPLNAAEPVLIKDEHPPTNTDPVTKATRSTGAQHKAQTKRTTTDEPCHSYKTLLAELATQARCTTRLPAADAGRTPQPRGCEVRLGARARCGDGSSPKADATTPRM